MKKISDFFYKRSNGYAVLGFFALQMLFSALILPHYQKQFDSNLNLGLMDLSFHFSPEKGYSIIESYGNTGREVYRFTESCIDILYPIAYTLSYILLLSFLFKKNGWNLGKWNLITLGAMVCDLCENFGIVQMLKVFPEKVDFWANFASNAGVLKWLFFGITIILFLASLVMWIVKMVKKKA
jgi:hypothetical protein